LREAAGQATKALESKGHTRHATRAETVLGLQRSVGNRSTATLLRDVGGWKDAAEGSGNEGESPVAAPPGGLAFRRIPLTGLPGAATDRAIVYIPATPPPPRAPIDVLLHLHGHPAGGPGGYLGGASDTDVTDPGDRKESRPSPQADDIDEYRIGAQLAAAGRPMVAILPQGVGKSDFGAGTARAFKADDYIKAVFDRLSEIGAWPAKDAPTPGPVILSGHSGADTPMTQMLTSDLGPKDLRGLFLFDTMYPGAGHVEKIWKVVKARLESELGDLKEIRDRPGDEAELEADSARGDEQRHGAGPADEMEAEARMLEYVAERGFRLFNVHGGGTYKPQSDKLQGELDAWFRARRVRDIVGGPGSPVFEAFRGNFEITRSTDRRAGVHMRILRHDDHLKRAVGMLSRQPVETGGAKPPATPTPEELVTAASERIHTTVRAAAAPFVGTPNAADIPGMLTMQIIKGKADPRKGLKRDNPMLALYDALWSDEVVADLATVDNPTKAKKRTKKDKEKAEEARRKIFAGLVGSLLPSSAAGAKVEAPAAPLDEAAEIATEKSLVSKAVTDLIPDKKWESVRVAVIVQFGGLVAGPRVAIDRANAYYGQLVRAKFLNYTGYTVVHPDLQAAFVKAEAQLKPRLAKLPKEEVDGINAAVKKMWSTVVRPNQNAKHKLSDHSFGWAIDIDAAFNPNISTRGGLAPVSPVTGEDPETRTTAGKDADDVEAVATELRTISRQYEAAMESATTLAPVLLRLANEGRRGAGLPELKAASGPALVAAIKQAKEKPRAEALRAALWPEEAAAKEAAAKEAAAKEAAAKEAAEKEAATKKPAAKKKTPPKKDKPKDITPATIASAEATIALVGSAYRSSFDAKGKRVGAQTEGTPGSVAAHGFMSLPPALVAALAGSDAGGLRWLGTVNQDFMHFELAKEPKLFTDADATAKPPADGAHGPS
jgi:hypothetical protein